MGVMAALPLSFIKCAFPRTYLRNRTRMGVSGECRRIGIPGETCPLPKPAQTTVDKLPAELSSTVSHRL